MKFFKLLPLLLVATIVTGCAQYEWRKQGASPADFNQDDYACQIESAHAFPVTMVTREVRRAYTTPAKTTCHSVTSKVKKETKASSTDKVSDERRNTHKGKETQNAHNKHDKKDALKQNNSRNIKKKNEVKSTKMRCVTTPAQYVPARFVTSDANASNRKSMKMQCLYARGWERVRVE